jgi:hypothetical protein
MTMGMAFWIRRYVVVFCIALVVIGVAQWLKGKSVDAALSHALLWSAMSTSVFIAARMYQSARKQHCALCRDTPEMQRGELRK